MTPTEQYDQYNAELRGSEKDPPYSPITLLDNQTLLAAAKGELDLNMVARVLVASRGIGPEGVWVGFKAAEEYWRGLAAPADITAARRAGSAKSEKKAAAARANGKKGGRKKNVQTFGQEDA